MIIYFSHSKNARGLYFALQNTDFGDKQFILPHEHTNESYPTLDLFKSGKCNLVLAEVSYRATGQGIELGWANLMDIPIVCIHHTKTTPSKSLSILTDVIMPYQDWHDFIPTVQAAIAAR